MSDGDVKHSQQFCVVIFLPLTILVEVDTDFKLPIPCSQTTEENKVKHLRPSEPNEVKPASIELKALPKVENPPKAQKNDPPALLLLSLGPHLLPKEVLKRIFIYC